MEELAHLGAISQGAEHEPVSRRARRFDRVPFLALLLVFFALAVRVAVPQGYMLSSEAGLPRITVCTGQGAVEMAIGADGQLIHLPEGSDHETDYQETCPFALAQFPGLDVETAPPPAQPLFAVEPSHGAIVHQRPGLGLAAPPPPSHGPPAPLT